MYISTCKMTGIDFVAYVSSVVDALQSVIACNNDSHFWHHANIMNLSPYHILQNLDPFKIIIEYFNPSFLTWPQLIINQTQLIALIEKFYFVRLLALHVCKCGETAGFVIGGHLCFWLRPSCFGWWGPLIVTRWICVLITGQSLFVTTW